MREPCAGPYCGAAESNKHSHKSFLKVRTRIYGVPVADVCTYDVTWEKLERIFLKVHIGKFHETLSTRPNSPLSLPNIMDTIHNVAHGC
jgi:hypothetical protein